MAWTRHCRRSHTVLAGSGLGRCGLYVRGYAPRHWRRALTVFQSLPVDGIIVVTSPQDLVSMIVTKAVNMAKMMDIPVLGLVENLQLFSVS